MRYGVCIGLVPVFVTACAAGGSISTPNHEPPTPAADAGSPPSSDTGTPSPTVDSAPVPESSPDVGTPAGEAPEAGPVATGDAAVPKPNGLTYKDFSCSWVLGIHTTYEWFAAGFEMVVDDARWQVSGIEMAQFNWANPNSNLWSSPITSPCTANSKTPDRIVFSGVDSGSTTAAQFLPQYLSVINIIKMRFPSVKRIDLMTLARAPGDIECKGANRSGSSWIKPGQDEAIAMTVAMFPGFVFSTPKWEVKSCSDFGLCPHISAAANADLAKTMGDYFIAN